MSNKFFALLTIYLVVQSNHRNKSPLVFDHDFSRQMLVYLFIDYRNNHLSSPGRQVLELRVSLSHATFQVVSVRRSVMVRIFDQLFVPTFVKLPVDPRALHGGVGRRQRTLTMRLILGPHAVVHIAVRVSFLAHSMHHPVLEFTHVFALVRPGHFAHAAWLIFLKLSFIDLAGVGKVVLTITVEHAIEEFASVSTSFTGKGALSGLLSIHKVSFIFYFVVIPVLLALPMLLVLLPIALI